MAWVARASRKASLMWNNEYRFWSNICLPALQTCHPLKTFGTLSNEKYGQECDGISLSELQQLVSSVLNHLQIVAKWSSDNTVVQPSCCWQQIQKEYIFSKQTINISQFKHLICLCSILNYILVYIICKSSRCVFIYVTQRPSAVVCRRWQIELSFRVLHFHVSVLTVISLLWLILWTVLHQHFYTVQKYATHSIFTH